MKLTTLFLFSVCLLFQVQAAHDPSADAAALRNKLNERWFETIVPEFLEKRKNEEAAYAGGNLPVAEYEEILKSDTVKKLGKISDLIDSRLYSSLQHQMKSKYLLAFLKEGQLVSRTGQYGTNSEEESLPGIYLELHTYKNPRPFAWGDVELHFDYSLLDREDYIISPFWDYGAYGPLAASPIVSPGRVAYYLKDYLLKGEQNEVVFMNPVSLSSVREIIVKKGQRNIFLSKIKEQKINCACDLLIKER